MRSRIKKHPKLAVLLVVVLALVFAGVAFAVWSFTQSTTNLQGKNASTLSLVFHNPSAGDLAGVQQCYPGGSCDLVAEVGNPASVPTQITTFQPSLAASYNATGCPATNYGGPAEAATLFTLGTPITVPASAVGFVLKWQNALTLSATAPSACQGQTISVTGGMTVAVGYTAGS